MQRSEAEVLNKRVVHYYQNIANHDIIKTCYHFMEEGYHRYTIKRIIRRYEERGTTDRKPKSGRPRSAATDKVIKKVEKKLKQDPNLSVRRGALQIGSSKSTFDRVKVHDLGIKAYHKEPAPKYKGDQMQRAKTGCRKIYRNHLLSNGPKILLMDDETYVAEDPEQIPGVQYYHCRSKDDIPDPNRFKRRTKFYKKYMVWQCIDELGNVSDAFICIGTINGEIYLKECLQKRLLPFIRKYHKNHQILLWMDMASSHYKREVTEWLASQNIEFVTRDENAPDVPQARPIERFWAKCKAAYKARPTPAKNLNSFKRIWKNISKKVAEDCAQALMKDARRNLRLIGYAGVYAPYKRARK